ncbi:MAG: hypothetical protein ACHRXM_06060 [Isosphaerales bacterium]
MTEVRYGAPSPEFSFQGLAAGEPVMCGPGLQVAFTRANDGLGHSLRLPGTHGSKTGEPIQPVPDLVSVAPAPVHDLEQADPSRVLNPVYQELVRHELPMDHDPGLCLLMTGSYLEHHFSAVFRLQRDPAMPSRIVLDVDVADRCRTPVKKLAATYQVHDCEGNPLQIDAGPHRIAWRGGRLGPGILELVAEPPAVVTRPEPHQSSVSVRVEATIDPQTFTQRLHYCWRWTSCAGLTR